MLPVGCLVPRRLAAGLLLAALLLPITAHAEAGIDVDTVWNQPDGISPDSAFYPVQSWWDGLMHLGETTLRQRGLRELTQANTDLLNAYSLLLRTRSQPQPVALIDPLLSTVYNTITGSQVKAPIGSLLGGINQALLNLERRGSRHDIIRALLKESQAKQAAAERDLQGAGPEAVALLSANRSRASALLEKIQSAATGDDGLASVLPSNRAKSPGSASGDPKGKTRGTPKGSPEPPKPKK